MRNEATLEQWRELFGLGAELKALEPWNDFYDMDLIVICPESKKEPYFCSIMGRSGSCYGVSVYKGYEGLQDFDMLAATEVSGMTGEYAMFEQRNLTCYWGDREEVPTEQKKVMKELDLKFRGKGQWLYFLSFQKRYIPFTPDAEEVNDLISVYRGLVEAVKGFRENNVPVDYEKGEYFWYIYHEQERVWKYEIHGLQDRDSREYPVIELEDEILKKKLQKRPFIEGELQIDFAYLNQSVKEKGYDRPINPLLFIVVDGETGIVVTANLLGPDEEEIDITLSFFVQFIEQCGRIEVVTARNPWVFSALEDLCEYCGIQLVNEEMPEMDNALSDMKKYFVK